MIFAGILAGGVGSRMEHADMPKQFLPLAGIPILARTVRVFLSVTEIDRVIITMNTDWADKYTEILTDAGLMSERIVLTAGGDTRFSSLENAVRCAESLDGGIIVTHDCARPFVTARMIRESLEAVKEYPMVTVSMPVIDTILESDDGKYSVSVPDRSRLWNDQGPQTFETGEFLRYAGMIPDSERHLYMEAGKVYLAQGKKVGIVRGSRTNFKITNDFDLYMGEYLIQSGQAE